MLRNITSFVPSQGVRLRSLTSLSFFWGLRFNQRPHVKAFLRLCRSPVADTWIISCATNHNFRVVTGRSYTSMGLRYGNMCYMQPACNPLLKRQQV